PEHKAAAEAIVLGRRRLGVVEAVPPPTPGPTLDLEPGDYDVAVPDLTAMGAIGPDPDTALPMGVAHEGSVAGDAEEGKR
ncbi:MAG TPA: hypothetical protein VIH37_06330, partial [Candidatus Limnocylindrales bacterium]